MSNHESNAELMFRLAAIDQAAPDAAAREKAVRDELVLTNLDLVKPCATWFRRNWKGRDPTPGVDELVSIGNTALVKAAEKIPSMSAYPAAYFRTAIKRAIARESFAEHATSGLPDETALRQLEVGEADGKKGIDWSKGYDGVLVPIPAGAHTVAKALGRQNTQLAGQAIQLKTRRRRSSEGNHRSVVARLWDRHAAPSRYDFGGRAYPTRDCGCVWHRARPSRGRSRRSGNATSSTSRKSETKRTTAWDKTGEKRFSNIGHCTRRRP